MNTQTIFHCTVRCDAPYATGRVLTSDGKTRTVSPWIAAKIEALLVHVNVSLTEDDLWAFKGAGIRLQNLKGGELRIASKVVLGPHVRQTRHYLAAHLVPPMPEDGPRWAPHEVEWP